MSQPIAVRFTRTLVNDEPATPPEETGSLNARSWAIDSWRPPYHQSGVTPDPKDYILDGRDLVLDTQRPGIIRIGDAATLGGIPVGSSVATVNDMKAFRGGELNLRETSREGRFIWDPTVPVATHQADTFQSIYIAPNPLIDGAYRRVLDLEFNIANLGAIPSTAMDVSALIQKLLDLHVGTVVVPAGTWRCDTMIILQTAKSLRLMPGARLQRYSAYSASTAPLVWLRGSNSVLLGPAMRTASIYTQNRCPEGIVRLGHENMQNSHATVTECTISGLEITGSTVGGQTTGDPDICLFVPNAQLGGVNASYYHKINNVLFSAANFGLNLRGWANGNTISNVEGRQLGNTTWGDGGLIWCQGALDNTLNGAQFHASSDQSMLIMEDYDNTGTPGGLQHNTQFNYWGGLVCEQGGVNARGVRSYASRGSTVQIISNTGAGNLIHNTWNADGNRLIDPVRDITGSPTGAGWTKTFQAVGTFTVRVTSIQALTGAVNRYGVIVLRFHGGENGGANLQSAEYRVPVGGSSVFNLGTPVNNWTGGSTLTITQTGNSATHVEFTVAGASVNQRSTLTVEAQIYPGARVD